MRYVLLAIVLFFSATSLVSAQVDTATFKVSIFSGNDITPPTTPVLLSAIPVASTQINLSWSTSTDNFSVSGYTVQRDAVTIATTTLLSYSDSGLVASTSYSYSVRAFDASSNYSTTSNTIATTTLDIPVVVIKEEEGEDNSTEGTSARVVLRSLNIDTGFSTSSIVLTTARPARIEIRWGRSDSYELGYIVSSVYKSDNSFSLTDLEPGTTYEYEIVGYTPSGVATVLATDVFTTKQQQNSQLPVNVSRFTATGIGNDVLLSWQLPKANISNVRIVRSHLGFPAYPNNGAIIYQGLRTQFTDTGVLSQYSPVYYTAFVYDEYGNVSSGAVAIVYAESREYLSEDEEDTQEIKSHNLLKPVEILDKATSSVDRDRVTPQMKMPESFEIVISQGERTFSLLDSPLELDSSRQILISIPVEAVVENLKSIIVTLVDPTDTRKGYSFLLRLNKDRSAYEALVSPLQVAGNSQILLEIYDFEAYVVASYQAPVVFFEGLYQENEAVVFPDVFFDRINIILLIILLLSIIGLLLLHIFRRTEDKTEAVNS